MQIRAVELDNTKSYDHARIEFTDGVNAIVGHNGAGKSTILEAIGLALFDALDYTRSEFVRSGTRTATMTVEVESNLDRRPYHIVRRMGGSNQHYVFDPELDLRICEGKADVLAFLRQHMGVDSRADLKALFKDAVGVPQGTFTAAFLLSAAPRKKVFDSLLQVEDYQQAFERLREPLRLLETRAQKLDVSVAGLQARLEQLPGLETAVSARLRRDRARRSHGARGAGFARRGRSPPRCVGRRAQRTGRAAKQAGPGDAATGGDCPPAGRGAPGTGGGRGSPYHRRRASRGQPALCGGAGGAETAGRTSARAHAARDRTRGGRQGDGVGRGRLDALAA